MLAAAVEFQTQETAPLISVGSTERARANSFVVGMIAGSVGSGMVWGEWKRVRKARDDGDPYRGDQVLPSEGLWSMF